MAERKSEIVVEFGPSDYWLQVTCDADMVERVREVGGVTQVDGPGCKNERTVWVDARHDINEIADEIRALAS